ncbi:phospholipid-binding protein [Kineobactrum sediminis]|uniref:Phospholipid-binding protein n=1 Tax=Kineobactrum sediminis TaxID=1905677 RepID=A0A2N5Y3H1_9GAMM|nr:BON domain-containing protein [Kineobactrum sediminis]PLW82927.1 phospholipid-binding protein [Kineobactrum sediminis]
MKILTTLTLVISTMLASGCGSMLATVDKGPIQDDPAKRTMAQRLEDQSIEVKAIVNINAADTRFDNAHLVAVSYNGFVLLAGQVPSPELKTLAADEVRKISGVRRIYNELEIGPAIGTLARTQDTWITSKIKAWLLANVDTPGIRTKVITENGVVYLMGLVTEEEAQRVADIAADITGVKRVVQLFELLPS